MELFKVDSKYMVTNSVKGIMIGDDSALDHVRQLIAQVSETDATVLLFGETGTGKELAARGLHYLSNRSGKDFVPINCGAIPRDLLESELFGHEKGAFSGAVSRRRGRFEMAQNGTLFLDEIAEMPMDMQVKILRVLQEQVIYRVGGEKPIEVNVRIVAATNRCLETAVSKGEFREDLFYRLNVFPIVLPPLRERGTDIIFLFEYFAQIHTVENSPPIYLTSEAQQELMRRQWPGNIRELSNLVERLSICFPGQAINPNHLPQLSPLQQAKESEPTTQFATQSSSLAQPTGVDLNEQLALADEMNLQERLRDIEKEYIAQALKRSEGNITHAAKLLGLGRTTLIEKIKKHKMSV
ncbi:MAG: sigma-54-dependent Fis family transcriptional regulator [Methylococcales bacterium]|nr:sigma-54-dependent Fis family transcriptional regulator [Methylococcales bacterium]